VSLLRLILKSDSFRLRVETLFVGEWRFFFCVSSPFVRECLFSFESGGSVPRRVETLLVVSRVCKGRECFYFVKC